MNIGLFNLIKSINPDYTEIDFYIFQNELEKWIDKNNNKQM